MTRKVKAVFEEVQQRRGRPKFCWYDGVIRAFAVGKLIAGGNATGERVECV